jgi:hypothetical protein
MNKTLLALALFMSSTSAHAEFKVGDCVRLSLTDVWEADTYKIKTVGNFSYELTFCLYDSCNKHIDKSIRFEDEKLYIYSKVECPKYGKSK